MAATDIGRHRVITTEPTAPIAEVAELLAVNGVGSVVVVSADAPVGVVTDRDVALAVAEHGTALEAVTAGDLMSEKVHTVSPAADLSAVTALWPNTACGGCRSSTTPNWSVSSPSTTCSGPSTSSSRT